jgi:hypothetical protein
MKWLRFTFCAVPEIEYFLQIQNEGTSKNRLNRATPISFGGFFHLPVACTHLPERRHECPPQAPPDMLPLAALSTAWHGLLQPLARPARHLLQPRLPQPCVTESPKNERFITQDHTREFSVKREYTNTIHKHKNNIMKLMQNYYTLFQCIRITRG